MIWTPKPKPKPTEPKLGDLRVVKKFAFLPVELINKDKLWLEYYYETQTLTSVGGAALREPTEYIWEVSCRTTYDTSSIARQNGVNVIEAE